MTEGTKKPTVRLRPPAVTFDRIKIAAAIIIYVALAEWVDPRAFSQTLWAKLLFLALTLEVIRQFWVYRLEVSRQHVVRSRRIVDRWRETTHSRLSANQRYRVRRLITILAGWWLLGWVIDGLTDRCTGALQCALIFPRLILENIPFIMQVALIVSISLLQLGAMFYAMTKVGFLKIIYPGTVDVDWDDIYGQDHVVERMRELTDQLENSDAVEAAGGHIPKGALLWGPPGTGKTMSARAAASASTKPLILLPPGAFASTFVGINFLKVWMYFRTLRKYSLRHDGVISFIDEIDVLGNRGAQVAEMTPGIANYNGEITRYWSDGDAVMWCGSTHQHKAAFEQPAAQWGKVDRLLYQVIVGGGSGMNMGTLEAFLAALDGMDEPRGVTNRFLKALGFKPLPAPKYRVLIVGATNLPDKVDAALLRAGRLGLKIHVPFPDVAGRDATYKGYLGKVANEVDEEQRLWFARRHHRGTGADIRDAVNEALLRAFRKGRESVEFNDLLWAIKQKQFGDSTGLFEDEKNVRAVAIHEAGHAVAFHHLHRHRSRIFVASIEKHGSAGGFVAPAPFNEDWLLMQEDLFADIQVSMASRVAEVLEYQQPSNGHGGDGRHATETAGRMIQYGHGETLGVLPADARRDGEYQEQLEAILEDARTAADVLLRPRMDQVRAVADLLEEKHTVDGDQIHALLDEMEPANA